MNIELRIYWKHFYDTWIKIQYNNKKIKFENHEIYILFFEYILFCFLHRYTTTITFPAKQCTSKLKNCQNIETDSVKIFSIHPLLRCVDVYCEYRFLYIIFSTFFMKNSIGNSWWDEDCWWAFFILEYWMEISLGISLHSMNMIRMFFFIIIKRFCRCVVDILVCVLMVNRVTFNILNQSVRILTTAMTTIMVLYRYSLLIIFIFIWRVVVGINFTPACRV